MVKTGIEDVPINSPKGRAPLAPVHPGTRARPWAYRLYPAFLATRENANLRLALFAGFARRDTFFHPRITPDAVGALPSIFETYSESACGPAP